MCPGQMRAEKCTQCCLHKSAISAGTEGKQGEARESERGGGIIGLRCV